MPKHRLYSPMQQHGRIMRRPVHNFALQATPYAIQPFMIAPVLPGETLRNALLQARAVTDPVKAPLTGWWLEYYFFYVKHRDLDIRDELTTMMLDPQWSDAAVVEAPSATEQVIYYTPATSGIQWTKRCLKRVVEEYFRNEGEAWDTWTLNGLPVASISGNTWLDSVVKEEDFNIDDVTVPELPADAGTKASEIEKGMRQYYFMRQHNLVDMTYEEFLGTYGVKVRPEQSHIPELIRFMRSWSYPSNTVDPSSGAARSALSWSVAERIDKDRFFSEPGFIFAVTVARPKVYLRNVKGSGVWYMRDAYRWLPAVLNGDQNASWYKRSAADGPLSALTAANGYWVDVRDILIYGDQFVNFALDGTVTDQAVLTGMPTTAFQKRYPSVLADIQALFVNGGTGFYKVRQDGVVQLNIAGAQRDETPGVPRQVTVG